MRKILRHLIPQSLKIKLHKWLQAKQRELKAPKMLRGFQDASGKWRPRTCISDTVFIDHPESVFIEDNVYVGHFSILDGTNDLVIEKGVQLAGWNGIYTHSSHIAIRLYGDHYLDIPALQKTGYKTGKVIIGKYVFVGAGAKIFPGVSIGKGALIAANSVITRNIEDFQIVSGNPAEVIGDTRKLDEKYLNDPQLREWYEEWQKNTGLLKTK